MKRFGTASLLLASLPGVRSWDVDGCTSVIVSAGATVDGSAITSHANDCQDCDFRMVYVPAKEHAHGSKRTVYTGIWDQYPRLVDPSRSEQYQADVGINTTQILGYIPEVARTYALWEASYGVMNEHGLGMGESTTPGYLVGKGIEQGGTALFSIGNLMTIALERCITARCAVQTMGELGELYGFYGEDPGQTGGGETATVVDKHGEAWVFHIIGGLGEGKLTKDGTYWENRQGALWAAQRLQEGHVAVVANAFIIQEIDFDNTEYFMFHPRLRELAKEAGLWDGQGAFNWQKLMSPDPEFLEYFPGMAPIPMYSTLRMWSVYRHAAPSRPLKPTPRLADFPFSVPVDKKVSAEEVMNWFRDHMEGTEFDMRLGALAGPWQSPNRVEGGHGQGLVPGQFARAISIPRTSYVVIPQTGISKPRVWFAPDAPASSVFVPFFADVLAAGDGKFDVESYGSGSMKTFSFNGGKQQPAWWAFDFVANWMELSYKNMSEGYVYPLVQEVQGKVMKDTEDAVSKSLSADAAGAKESAGVLAEAQTTIQRQVVTRWWDLANMLVVRYNDYAYNFPEHAPTTQATIGYPAFWLEMIGYNQEFYKPKWVQPAAAPPLHLAAAERLLALESCKVDGGAATPAFASDVLAEKPSAGVEATYLVAAVSLTALFAGAGGAAAGFLLGRRAAQVSPAGEYYKQIA
eukprot:TRINITY_DN2879_c0_g1_i4.p1 TRINITY_DN2879_c0_g1~~TRINITY_DN2879_c0_g1_i4.p1  ORF type:complete len:690 (-),score=152.97 TRINITY_DN2879_c0_g1_i4:192-2261(-)